MNSRDIDYITRDYYGFKTSMMKELILRIPTYTDTSQTDAGVVLLELNAVGLDILSYYLDSMSNEVYLSTAEQRSSVLKWCEILGYIPKTKTSSIIEQVFIATHSNGVSIPKGTVVNTPEDAEGNIISFETLEDYIIPVGATGGETDIDGKYIYTNKIVHGITIKDEILGSSTYVPNQQFNLGYDDVVKDSVQVAVDEGVGFVEWERVDTFIDSQNSDKHFVVVLDENDKAKIIFGDGLFGKIPYSGDDNIKATYRQGGGLVGNVNGYTITLLENSVVDIKETFNPNLPLVFGTDSETLTDIKKNAPQYNVTKWGAITLEDFSNMTLLNFNQDVLKAYTNQNENDIDSVDIHILLEENIEYDFENIKEEIVDFFSPNTGGHALVGVNNVNVLNATKNLIRMKLKILIAKGFDKTLIEEEIQQYLNDYFKNGNYDFNQTLYVPRLQSDILSKSGVQGILTLEVQEPLNLITPALGEILALGEVLYETIEEGE